VFVTLTLSLLLFASLSVERTLAQEPPPVVDVDPTHGGAPDNRVDPTPSSAPPVYVAPTPSPTPPVDPTLSAAPAVAVDPPPSPAPAVLDLTWRPAKHVWFRPGGVIQARYTFNHREELSGEPANTSRFSVARARLILDGGLTDYISFRVRVGVLSNGDARFEQAYADVKLSDQFTLRAGILYLHASIGDAPAPQDMQGIDYTHYGLQTSGGNAAAAGARANFGPVRMQAFFSNGLRTGFSEFAEPLDARLAVTGRVETRLFTGDGFDRFDTESSFRGSDFAVRLGAAAHYQQGRVDGALPGGDLQQYTADVTLEASGFNLIVAGRLLRIAPEDGETTHDPGLWVQTGVFVHERIELWARYDALFSDGKFHSYPSDRNGLRDDYQAIGGGINGYLIPRTNMAKLQADFTYVPDPISSTWAEASDNAAVLFTESKSQWALRAQIVLGY